MMSKTRRQCTCPLVVFLLSVAALFSDATAQNTDTVIGIAGRDFVMMGYLDTVTSNILVTSAVINKVHVMRESEEETVVIAATGDLPDVETLMAQIREQVEMEDFAAMAHVDFEDLQQSTPIPARTSGLSVTAIAKLARTCIAQNLRTASPYRVGLLLAGMHSPKRSPPGRSLFGVTTARKKALAGKPDHVAGQVQQQLQRSTSSFSLEAENEAPEETTATAPARKEEPHLYWLDEYGSLQKIWYGSHGLGSNFVLAVLDQGYNKNLSRQQAAELIQRCFQQLEKRYIINSPRPPVIKCIDSKGCQCFDLLSGSKGDVSDSL
ncbi:Proteasome subunit beta type-2 [Seminavis robusta]|uniref:Proteasome subunit beta type-2 n=1 Tax=Seminavis robusta TaxID=568900 RepID=A0A9N8HGX4_9STRA|nr:Proteasome subunit beta type-2 [Seminavis robusta]|eukprot:Sro602_g173710.1 Proteasome subunit beta type-2 (322) ;mRNA; r:27066-28031